MIEGEQEYNAINERIAYFQRLLAHLRVNATPQEFPALSSGYRFELEQMQREVVDYLSHHASEARSVEAA